MDRRDASPPNGPSPAIESASSAQLHAPPVFPLVGVRSSVADGIAALCSLAAQSKDRLQIHRCERAAGLEGGSPHVPRRSRGCPALRDPEQARRNWSGVNLAKTASKRLSCCRLVLPVPS